MLKALELVGFKSFADKTRFEFPPGITVVVGPNGSGKSNVVDAIKWVLGEQSVKSLRGKEMVDVIFNGSSSRRPQNSAECTLTFDNRNKLLPIDTDEVHVGRRVYRSGEGEYLINGEPCRLRDIRDLLAGTGVSTQAYSIIEQGKVDVMLQSSPRDRRLIFEEAAGISRFKAKKLESIRRLDRVEQNLLRLSDIVDEVEGRLKTVRKQATKARRYREHTERLQELRTQVGLADWRRLTEQLDAFQKQLESRQAVCVEQNAQADIHETRCLELDVAIVETEETLRQGEQAAAENRERIAGCESAIQYQRTQREDLQRETERRRNQLTTMSSRSRDLGTQLESVTEQLASAEAAYEGVSERTESIADTLADLTHRFNTLRRESEGRRSSHMDFVRQVGTLGNEIISLETRIQTASSAFQRCRQMLTRIESGRSEVAEQLTALRAEKTTLSEKLAVCEQEGREAREQSEQQQKELAEAQRLLGQLRESHSGLSERALVLEELEKRQEGLSSGAKEVLHAARQSPQGPFRQVRGLVADVLEVPVEIAPAIEATLGERAGHLVVAPGSILRRLLADGSHTFEGPVGFVPVEGAANVAERSAGELGDPSGVVGRADQLVKTAPEFAGLAKRLLGSTWIVETFADALALAETTVGQTFVTCKCERVLADGTICVGPSATAGGLISRRSELRHVQQQIDELASRIGDNVGKVDQRTAVVADAHARVETLRQQRDSLHRIASECHQRISASEERHSQVEEKYMALSAELDLARGDRDAATADLALLRDRRKEIEEQTDLLEESVTKDQHELDAIDAQRHQVSAEVTTAKVELAKSEQAVDNLKTRMQQFQQDHEERQRAIDESQSLLDEAVERSAECERSIAAHEAEVAELYASKETLAQKSQRHAGARDQARGERGTLQVESQKLRAAIRKIETECHEIELEAGQVRHERDTLAIRMREDYEIELADVEHDVTEEEQHAREAIEVEIAELRRKISNIGNVNLEALEELEDTETRFTELSEQYRDLTAAKKSLEQIIEKINVDSRRLFTETLETVRGHFQGLFRKLFGGGQADIIMDEEVDILESGLEIVARPPGKEPRNISLLSGGEKTLTCVALLLAIFRSRPSPFCVLDEVDAALDEANIERFTRVLQEFLAWTQFIVVTHSKKTMTCAGTLYGVTMQESGISKRVSVQFDDVSEDGEILRTSDGPSTASPADSAIASKDDDEPQAA